MAGIAKQSNDKVVAVINYWPRLSDEIVLFILRLLPQKDRVTVSKINRRFHDLSQDDSLWTELTFDYENIKENIQSCRDLVVRCGKLSHIKITNKLFDDPPPSPVIYEDDSDDENTNKFHVQQSQAQIEIHLTLT